MKEGDGMNWEKVFEIEYEFYEEVLDYINSGSKPRDEEKEICYKAYAAVQDYRKILQQIEKENAPGGANT